MTPLRGTEAGPPPASDLDALFRAHGLLIGRLPVDVPDPVDDDEVWIEPLRLTMTPRLIGDDDGCECPALYDVDDGT